MAWSKLVPRSTDSLSVSQGALSGNFTQIESVLGSSTLSAGISKIAGDMFYASDTELIQRLAKASDAYQALVTDGTNPSWGKLNVSYAVTGILQQSNGGTGSSTASYCNLAANVYGTLPSARGGTGFTLVNASNTGALTDNTNKTITFATAFANTNYFLALGPRRSDGEVIDVTVISKAAASFVIRSRTAGADDCDYIAIGNR